jgi:hypothetical protein
MLIISGLVQEFQLFRKHNRNFCAQNSPQIDPINHDTIVSAEISTVNNPLMITPKGVTVKVLLRFGENL